MTGVFFSQSALEISIWDFFKTFFCVVVVVLRFEDSLGNQLPKCFMQFYTFGFCFFTI